MNREHPDSGRIITSGAADRAIEGCPELNMGNYDEVDVERLNDWAIRANDEIDRLHALAAGQATAAQAGEYPALVCDYCGALTPDPWHSSGMLHGKMSKHIHSCDACAARGQAPTDAKALAEADRRAGEAERLLATCKEAVMRFEQVRSRMKYQWGAEQRVSFDEVWDEALALKKAAQAAPQAADSVTAPAPPPECETEAEKRAFAFGWFKALESERMKADNKKKDPL